ncbi:hypothetical protein SPBR_00724 [Sporothrix brasiliensis 5110]|uniref:Uncharacterized protein n=1 Tax=Sporothrix brasiliensis 5110 TaxID=1398154 RepID=A0A0C2FI39_9PEZI|nr:uncharacterized protein SPBR_00724 [Sporothrix brasiliensis 5110]KIH90728.1 hypothetical protein SPBR_00724 [Sporothrix brasiliensis 5110]
MDHQNKGAHTPSRFLSVRGQRMTSSAASSAESSPPFLSWRQATTPSRPSVAGPAKSLATDLSGGARLPQYWPSFGDAVRQKEADDVVFGIRKRTTAARATVIDGRPMTLVTRPTSLARRLLSEPGARGAVSPSSSPTTEATPGQERPGKPTRLSPTALDWAPRANALSPRLSSLSYADVARIRDRRPPPPPFPILRKPRSPHASLASTGTIVRPGASSSNTTGSSNGSEMDDGRDSDKESKTTTLEIEATKTAEITQADEFTELTVRITTSDDCETLDTSPSCHGLGNALGAGLGLLGKSADEDLSIGASDDLLVNRHNANTVFMRSDGGRGSRPKCPGPDTRPRESRTCASTVHASKNHTHTAPTVD